MIPIEHLKIKYPRVAALIGPHIDTLRKAITFALIGVVNVMIDGGVFLIAYAYLNSSEAALRRLDAVATACGCAPREKLVLISANLTSWAVAVSCSYVMNSHITFAAESGRRLRWRDYGTFVASGILGAIANTVGLLVAADFMPVLAAKGCGILAGFGVNFSMSHFVVFRRRPAGPRRATARGRRPADSSSSLRGAAAELCWRQTAIGVRAVMRIIQGDFSDPRATDLLHIHLTNSRAQTAPGSDHALDATGLQSPEISFWTIWEDETLLGLGALRRLSAEHGEVKSMHIAQAMRQRGAGRATLRHIIAVARARGMSRLSLETGSWDYFSPAHALYRSHGFLECPPFADYVPDPNSVFMSLDLREL